MVLDWGGSGKGMFPYSNISWITDYVTSIGSTGKTHGERY